MTPPIRSHLLLQGLSKFFSFCSGLPEHFALIPLNYSSQHFIILLLRCKLSSWKAKTVPSTSLKSEAYRRADAQKASIFSVNRIKLCVPPKLICWKLICNVMVFGGGVIGRWLGLEGAVLMDEISVFIKENLERILPPCEKTERRWLYEPESGFSLATKSASALILDFPGSMTEK